jgi:hypothetical protein
MTLLPSVTRDGIIKLADMVSSKGNCDPLLSESNRQSSSAFLRK